MLLFVVVFLGFASCGGFSESEDHALFEKFIRKYNKPYSLEIDRSLYTSKLAVFSANLAKAREMQKRNPMASFGGSPFMDLTPDEFRKQYLMSKEVVGASILRSRLESPPVGLEAFPNIPSNPPNELPGYFDWYRQGCVTPIKDQGQCGSCWTFSSTGCMEGQICINDSYLFSFSEQEILDCVTRRGRDEGCNGGYYTDAFQWIIQYGAILERYYPYEEEQDYCQYDQSYVTAYFSSYNNIQQDAETIAQVTWQHGPVSVSLDASCLQYYDSGIIYQDCGCKKSPQDSDHAVLVTGFGSEWQGQPVDFWIVKNSWGADWGDNGYFGMTRGHNTCGIEASVATINA